MYNTWTVAACEGENAWKKKKKKKRKTQTVKRRRAIQTNAKYNFGGFFFFEKEILEVE